MSKNTFIKRTITVMSLTIIASALCLFLFAFYKTITMFGVMSVSEKKKTDSNKELVKNEEPNDLLKQFKEGLSSKDETSQSFEKNMNKKSSEASKINLNLLGTITGSKTDSMAIINDPETNKQSFCKIGDKIKDATLTKIFRNKVALNVNGYEEFLFVKEKAGEQIAELSQKPTSDKAGDVKNQFLSQIEDKSDDKEEIEKQAKNFYKPIIPLTENGEFKGVKMNNITSSAPLFGKMGLKNNDIILGINDRNFNSFEDVHNNLDEEYKKLSANAKEKQDFESPLIMNWQVLRNGKVENIEFDASLIYNHYKGINTDKEDKENK